jgi:hypothetical protein
MHRRSVLDELETTEPEVEQHEGVRVINPG